MILVFQKQKADTKLDYELSSEGSSVRFDLFLVSILENGHYTAYVKLGQTWGYMPIDGEGRVTRAHPPRSDVKNATLFYRRVKGEMFNGLIRSVD